MLLDRLTSVHWTWMIYSEMFLAGVAGGAYVAAALLEVSGRGRSPTARVAHLLTFPVMLLVTLLLIVDLSRPERFWHMAVMSERLLPMFKPWSPMSIGTTIVILFSVFAFVSFLDALVARRVFGVRGWTYERTLHGTPLGLAWSLIGAILGMASAIYSGVLLTVSNIPGWAGAPLIPPVYAATAAITGIAAVLLVQSLRGRLDADARGLQGANTWLIAWWLVVVAIFLISLLFDFGSTGQLFLTTWPALAIGAAVVLGAIPLILRYRPTRWTSAPALSAALVLVAGLLIRIGIVMGPQEWLH